MELKKNDDFNTNLNFGPFNPAKTAGLAHSTHNTLIAGFDLESSSYVIDHGHLNSERLLQLWIQLYPNLTFMEKARLTHHPLVTEMTSPFYLLNEFYGFNTQLNKISSLLLQLKPHMQKWLSQKSFGPSELLALMDFSIEEMDRLIAISIEKNDSRQLASLRFELMQELKGLGYNFDTLIPLEIEELKKCRYPITHLRDEKFLTYVKNWPVKTRAKAQRRGDLIGFDVNFFVSSPAELEKLSEQLKKVANEWNSNQQIL